MMNLSSTFLVLLLLSGCGEEYSSSSTVDENIDLDMQRAEYLFNYNCTTCHGSDAKGEVGPNIVNASVSRIDFAIETVDLMHYLNKLTQEERTLISAYLQTL